jgi:hypothetical protein
VEAGLPIKSFWGMLDASLGDQLVNMGAYISDDEGGSHFGSDYHDDDTDDSVEDEPYGDDEEYDDQSDEDEPY